jgi:hypothetical protein
MGAKNVRFANKETNIETRDAAHTDPRWQLVENQSALSCMGQIP